MHEMRKVFFYDAEVNFSTKNHVAKPLKHMFAAIKFICEWRK